jgi:hypothetical protein
MKPTQEAEVIGSIPRIVRNNGDFYEGDLSHYYQAVFNHARNLNNPYHNFRHMTHVLYLCHQACVFYKETMSPREMRNLLIAALFHDFNHSGKTGPDIVNIKRAIIGLKRHIAPTDEGEFKSISALIALTEYPYKIPSEKLDCLSAQILRDSDMSQSFSVAWIQQVVFGLAEEWGKTPLDVLKMQGVFHNNLKFHTDWAKAAFPEELIRRKIAEAEALLALLSGSSVSAE